MRRILIFLFVVLLMPLGGCIGGENEPSSVPSTTTKAPGQLTISMMAPSREYYVCGQSMVVSGKVFRGVDPYVDAQVTINYHTEGSETATTNDLGFFSKIYTTDGMNPGSIAIVVECEGVVATTNALLGTPVPTTTTPASTTTSPPTTAPAKEYTDKEFCDLMQGVMERNLDVTFTSDTEVVSDDMMIFYISHARSEEDIVEEMARVLGYYAGIEDRGFDGDLIVLVGYHSVVGYQSGVCTWICHLDQIQQWNEGETDITEIISVILSEQWTCANTPL